MKPVKYKAFYANLGAVVRDLFTIGNNEPTFEITLNSSTAVTSITNQLVGKDSVIQLMPLTVAAGTENYFISARGKESFDITHSSGTSLRTFGVSVYG